MTDSAELIKEAEALAKSAEHETNEKIRQRLLRMAEHYRHLADSKNWSANHPPTPGALAELLVPQKR